jgi:hypothetical protein
VGRALAQLVGKGDADRHSQRDGRQRQRQSYDQRRLGSSVY